MSTTELSKGVRENNELIKIKNKQFFSVIVIFTIIPLCFVLSRNFMFGDGVIANECPILNDTYIHMNCGYIIVFDQNIYKIINPTDFLPYMENGLEVNFIGVRATGVFLPCIYLLYVIEPNEFPPISLVLLKLAAIFLVCLISVFGIIYLLYKMLMFKDKRIYLKGSKFSNLMKKLRKRS